LRPAAFIVHKHPEPGILKVKGDPVGILKPGVVARKPP
jgi:hypothetical protein